METCQARLKADLVSCFFENNFFSFILFIGMIKLGDLKQNPESLAVKLFAQVSVKKLRHFIVFGDSQESEDITQG